MTPDELEDTLQAVKRANLELIQHSQSLAEHLRIQMEVLLESIRKSKDTYTEHVQFMTDLIEKQKKHDENKDTTTNEV